MRALKN